MSALLTSAPLTASDRCDRCGAQAFVIATFSTGDLIFCQHHGRQYAETMSHSATSILPHNDPMHFPDDCNHAL